MQSIQVYLSKLESSLASGHATEHTYRPELRDLFVTLTNLTVINEPKRSEHGAPDFIFLDGMIPVAYGEAKDMHISLEKVEKSEQLSRYFGYARLILTNGVEFRFYKNGVRYGDPISLATKIGNRLDIHTEQFSVFVDSFQGFLSEHVDTIRSASHLAQIMGGKARRIRDSLRQMVSRETEQSGKYVDLFKLYNTFRDEILHDITYESFADLYAQTLVYGLFVARYHDETPENFTRMEARELVPKSNPLLRRFFDHIAGEAFERGLAYIVDELCGVFLAADVHALMHGLYQRASVETHDPVIHFYEDFLREYDPSLRMERGVFYTPAPVVRFIVRAVDDVLKTHFGLRRGLADTSKIEHDTLLQGHDKKGNRKTEKRQIHRVQILDPATGTGTFLNEVIRHIHSSMTGQEGMWNNYVQSDLLPRLHGFELMMASYTIAHLKLGLTLAETGVTELNSRLQIYLTNSLEEAKLSTENQGTLFGLAESITEEGRLADGIKRDHPIMVVIGNPPYSGESGNKGLFEKELGSYKQEPGGGKLKEKNSKWLNDDYVKFFRFAESMVEKNNEGVVAFITNHGYLDNPTFRGMRWHLLTTFDHISIVDLHGNSKKKETARDGSKDENVFDIMQGTAVFIGVKTGKKKEGELAVVEHIDIYGKRKEKYDWLENSILSDIKSVLLLTKPHYFFTQKDFSENEEYEKGFSIDDLFTIHSLGIQTHRDSFAIDISKEVLSKRISDFFDLSKSNDLLISKYGLKETKDWQLEKNRKGILDENRILPISYRIFDDRYIYLSKNIVDRDRRAIMQHMQYSNLALTVSKQQSSSSFRHIFISNKIQESCLISLQTKEQGDTFPLYLHSDSATLDGSTRTANLDPVIWAEINDRVGETTPEQILDYIYAVLHSPSYRDKYREFLKIDFPRVPYPRDREQFLSLVALGGELRALHLLESPRVDEYITTYPVAGSNEVEKIVYTDGQVYINSEQYFGEVPVVAWEFHIGGYQPAQKWLKDRKGRTLTWEDIGHYQQMIVAMSETARVMVEVDGVLESNGK